MSYIYYYEQNTKGEGEGNWYFRILSSYYTIVQNYYQNFRQLIHDIFVENVIKFIDFYLYSYIVNKKNQKMEKQFYKYLNKYALNMEKIKLY